MKLLHTTHYTLEDFVSYESIPKYAVLSHTWGEEEVLYHDIAGQRDPSWHGKAGALKVLASCERARKDGMRYIWIDTCCIDKSSSAELSEAINSMFAWYRHSAVCYAFLSDVNEDDPASFERSRWFTRGFTLQELIAPDFVEFYDREWNRVGNRVNMADKVSSITGIEKKVLTRGENFMQSAELSLTIPIEHILRTLSAATKMTWQRHRHTTRIEDGAYCLMGIFGVNMPLLYGEGTKAWDRLVDEIIKKTADHSILAFGIDSPGTLPSGQPLSYADNIGLSSKQMQSPMILLAGNLTMEAWLCPVTHASAFKVFPELSQGLFVALLDCEIVAEPLSWPVILLVPNRNESNIFRRVPETELLKINLNSNPVLMPCSLPCSSSKDGMDASIELWNRGSGIEKDFWDLVVDFQQVKRQTITITTRKHISLLRPNPPLHLKPLEQPATLQYEADYCQPSSLGGLIDETQPSATRGFRSGAMLFSEYHRRPFIVVWKRLAVTNTEERVECDAWFLADLDQERYKLYLENPEAAVHDEQSKREVMSDVPAFFLQNPAYKIATRAEEAEVSTMHEDLLVNVRLVKHVLDRDIRQLVVRISHVFDDNETSESKISRTLLDSHPKALQRDSQVIDRGKATDMINSGRRFAQWFLKSA